LSVFTLRPLLPHVEHLRRDLNPQQWEAVSAGAGPKLVIAGAGSGKTRVVTYRVAYLIAQGVAPSGILMVTFTNKAAREMLSRVEALVGDAARRVWGGTFHAIGNRILRHHAHLLGYHRNYTILDEEDQKDFLKLCIADEGIPIREVHFPSPALVRGVLSFSCNTGTPVPEVLDRYYPHFSEWAEALERIQARYRKRKRAANAMDYDDLLVNWLRLLREFPEVLERYGRRFQHILVDEYQDTNLLQAEIAELLASRNGRNIMVVGDDAQSIYAFRGAHYDNIFRFPERNPGTEIFRLEITYRSTPQILDFANASISNNRSQFPKTLRPTRPDGPKPFVVPVEDVYQEARFVAGRVLELRDEGVPLNRIAVLYRAHSHSMVLQGELARRGIPYEVRSGIRFLEQAHIKDVLAYLRIVHNPYDEVAWRRVLLTLPGVGNARAARIWERIASSSDPLRELKGAGDFLPSSVLPSWERFVEDMEALWEAGDRGPGTLIEIVLDSGYRNYLRTAYENSESRLEDLYQLAVLAGQYGDLEGFLSELVLLGELYGQDVRPGVVDAERLVLSSVHQAKGLEWWAVFLLRMAEGCFPSSMALREEGGEEEERRVFYVATTRAQQELYMIYPFTDYTPSGSAILLGPSRFLREVEEDLYQVVQVEEG